MLIDLRNKNITGKEAEKALVAADLTVNKNMVPYDDKSPFVTSGIRIGSAAITSRGFKESDCQQVIEWIDAVITNHDQEHVINDIRSKVNAFMADFPLYASSQVPA